MGYPQNRFFSFAKKFPFNASAHNGGAIILNNGMIVFAPYYGCWGGTSSFLLDINGIKGPNRIGYDTFFFSINSLNKLEQTGNTTNRKMGAFWSTKACCSATGDRSCNSASTWTDNGTTCADYALTDKNPTDSSKGYWNSLK